MESKGRVLILQLASICLVALSGLAGCSAGGDSAIGALKTGVFVDSPVDGLEYKALTPSGEVIRTGITEGGGRFTYRDGEIVSFSIGGVALGEAFAKAEMTPVDLVPGAFNERNDRVTDIARLLQSLDSDDQPENGITITQQVRSGCRATTLRMTLDSPDAVEQGVVSLVRDLADRGLFAGTHTHTVRSKADAQAHMKATLAKSAAHKRGALATFADREELVAYFKEQFSSRLLSTPLYGPIMWPVGASEPLTSTAGTASDTPAFSATNVQEEGVDEADVVKTDGEHLYVAAGGKVTISKVFPAEGMRVVGSVQVKGTVDSLYLFQKTLVVLYRPQDGTYIPAPGLLPGVVGCPRISLGAKTGVLMVNVEDPSRPATILDFVADGMQVASRVTGGRLYLVQQYFPSLPSAVRSWYNGTEEDRQGVIQANRDAIAAMTYSDFIPSYTLYDASGQPLKKDALVEPAKFYRPLEPQGGSMVTVTTLNLESPSPIFSAMGMVADVGTFYASTRSLYLAATRWNQTGAQGGEETVIQQLDLSADTVLPQGSAVLKGRLLNQFSLGEYDGVLRVALTSDPTWGGSLPPTNSVYCLHAQNDALEVIGKVENLAAGEHIYAARFIGPRGFLVTYKKIDPLYTLDLSDPANPRVAGELKVPGYSTYLHLLDESHLLSVGKDAVADPVNATIAWYQGVQLSIFDISDFANPTLMHKELIGVRGTDSEGLYNHKALIFLPQKNLFALPVNVCEFPAGHVPQSPSEFGGSVFNGLYVYRVTPATGFQMLGRMATEKWSAGFYPYWTRGIFIDSMVYAVQPDQLFAADTGIMSVAASSLSW